MSGVELMLNMMVPFIIAVVALYGMLHRVDVYDALVCGAGDGLGVLIRIVPPLIGLLTAVYMLRASGALELAAGLLGPILERLGIPAETVALLLVRPVSGSAALGVGADLIQTYGPDSLVGRTARRSCNFSVPPWVTQATSGAKPSTCSASRSSRLSGISMGKYTFSWPVALKRASISSLMRSQMAYP